MTPRHAACQHEARRIHLFHHSTTPASTIHASISIFAFQNPMHANPKSKHAKTHAKQEERPIQKAPHTVIIVHTIRIYQANMQTTFPSQPLSYSFPLVPPTPRSLCSSLPVSALHWSDLSTVPPVQPSTCIPTLGAGLAT